MYTDIWHYKEITDSNVIMNLVKTNFLLYQWYITFVKLWNTSRFLRQEKLHIYQKPFCSKFKHRLQCVNLTTNDIIIVLVNPFNPKYLEWYSPHLDLEHTIQVCRCELNRIEWKLRVFEVRQQKCWCMIQANVIQTLRGFMSVK